MLRCEKIVFIFFLCGILSCKTAPPAKKGRLIESSIIHDGLQRYYLLYLPVRTGIKVPLLLCLHGGGGTAEAMIRLTENRFNDLADARGIIVVYPQGIQKQWNDARNEPISYAHRHNIDDVGFIEDLIDTLSAKYPVDTSRVFVCGISNGGIMSYRLACEIPQKIAGVAAVSANLPVEALNQCPTGLPTKILVMNGTADPIMPYEGGEIRVLGKDRGQVLSTERTIEYFAQKYTCNPAPIVMPLPDTDPHDGTNAVQINYLGCARHSKVTLISVKGGGHAWPGGRQYLGERLIGKTSRDFNACDLIWNFFSEH